MKSVFFIPVFNQIQELPRVLETFKEADPYCDTLLFVNDGSTDGSEEVLKESGHPLISNEQRTGLGYSYMRALDWALERDYDLFGTIAANGKMLPAEMGKVMAPVLTGEVDYVTGSRFLDGGDSPNLPGFRQNAIPMVNFFVRVVLGKSVTDATCGYRAFRLDIIRQAEFDWKKPWMFTYGFEYYLYAKVLLSKKFRSKEIPVTMRYPKKGKRYTKIKPGLDWFNMLKPWVIARIDKKSFKDD